MASPLSMSLSMMARTSLAYSSGAPSRDGNGTPYSRVFRNSSETVSNIGVANSPGMMVMTRMP